jgi:hypothetical protein
MDPFFLVVSSETALLHATRGMAEEHLSMITRIMRGWLGCGSVGGCPLLLVDLCLFNYSDALIYIWCFLSEYPN